MKKYTLLIDSAEWPIGCTACVSPGFYEVNALVYFNDTYLGTIAKNRIENRPDVWVEVMSVECVERQDTPREGHICAGIRCNICPPCKPIEEETRHYAKSIKDLKGIDSIMRYRTFGCAHESQEIAMHAFCQLTQLLEEIYVGENWRPDWGDPMSYKFCIVAINNSIEISCELQSREFLALPSAQIRDTFLENHKELIAEYFLMYKSE